MQPKTAIVFPGQGSQKPGMGKELFDASPAVQSLYAEVGGKIGLDLCKLCFDTPEDELRQTQLAQPALFVTGVAAYQDLRVRLPAVIPAFMAGHSIGEYCALVCSGVLSINDAALVVKRRGEIMASAGRNRPGAMAAVLGGDKEAIEAVCASLSRPGSELVIANYNCPGQIVISGDSEAVEAAEAPLKEVGCKRVIRLKVSGAFHSPLMDEGAVELGEALAQCEFLAGEIPVVSNVTANLPSAPEDWRRLMQQQLTAPVRWVQSIEMMAASGVTRFVECGPGKVLCGLVRQIVPDAEVIAYNEPNDLDKVTEVSR